MATGLGSKLDTDYIQSCNASGNRSTSKGKPFHRRLEILRMQHERGLAGDYEHDQTPYPCQPFGDGLPILDQFYISVHI